MNNKEVVDKLQEYYLTQDIQTVTRLCANFAIDINRFYYFEKLSIEEKFNLIQRTKHNLNINLKVIEGKAVDKELTLSYDDEEENELS